MVDDCEDVCKPSSAAVAGENPVPFVRGLSFPEFSPVLHPDPFARSATRKKSWGEPIIPKHSDEVSERRGRRTVMRTYEELGALLDSAAADEPNPMPSDPNLEECYWLHRISTYLGMGPTKLGALLDEDVWKLGSANCYGCVGSTRPGGPTAGTTAEHQKSFAAKHISRCRDGRADTESEYDFMFGLNLAGIGFSCNKGLNHGIANQDNVAVFVTDDIEGRQWKIACVFDGHGGDGHIISHMASRIALWCILKLLQVTKGNIDSVEGCLNDVFGLIHAALVIAGNDKAFDVNSSGTTGTVVLVRAGDDVGTPAEAICAWVGDSRCVLGARKPDDKKPEGTTIASYTAFSTDHKPEDEEEKKRIEANGGVVARLPGDVPYRVFNIGTTRPGLAMSRSFCDLLARNCGVTWEPSVNRQKLDHTQFIFLASDGVWEFMKTREVGSMIYKMGRENVQEACAKVYQESNSRWLEEEGDVVDDITAICIWL